MTKTGKPRNPHPSTATRRGATIPDIQPVSPPPGQPGTESSQSGKGQEKKERD